MKCLTENCQREVNKKGYGKRLGMCVPCCRDRKRERDRIYHQTYHQKNKGGQVGRPSTKSFVMPRQKRKTAYNSNDIQRATPPKVASIVNGIFSGEYTYAGGVR